MGIYDRDYFQKERRGANPIVLLGRSAVSTLIAINVAVWFVQITAGESVTRFLAASADEVFRFQLWKLVTANFAHSRDIWHIVWNMLFLLFFGRELESIYGRRDFYIFYLAAGVLSILAEVVFQHFFGQSYVPILGASGAVMAVVVLFTIFYPTRQILFLFFIPAPIWILCAVFILRDLLGVFSGQGGGIANLAHLTGAAVGAAYWFFDLRFDRVRRLLPERRPRRARGPKVSLPRSQPRQAPRPREDAVVERIDDLLAKISAEGKDSLTEEEWEFLKVNSGKYRRE